VEGIGIETGPVAFSSAGIRRPKIGVEGKFSLWFLSALALAEGRVTLEKFTDEKVKDPTLGRLMDRIDAQLVRELKFGARVLVRMKDGTAYKGYRKTPKGDPANPLSFEELASKFVSLAKGGIPEGNAERLVERIGRLEDARDMGEIMALTAP
jgi:2-methylcitrate dehydratase PrpD